MHAPRQYKSSDDGLPQRSYGAASTANSAGAHVRLGEKDGEVQRLLAGMWRLVVPSRRSRSVRRCRNPLSSGRFGPMCRLRVRRIVPHVEREVSSQFAPLPLRLQPHSY